jgi:hypothetical protein
MESLGIVSCGPIAIGPAGSDALAEALARRSWVFCETAHLRWASNQGTVNLSRDDQKRLAPFFDELRAVVPELPKRVTKLDPYLRMLLFARRGEEFYARFQRVLQVTDADFPAVGELPEVFMGAGPYLGQKDKYEVVLNVDRDEHKQFVRSFSGAAPTDSLRWQFPEFGKLVVSVPLNDELVVDRWQFAHVVNNLSHMFLSGYKYFSYDPPIWLDAGLAYAMEKEIEPEFTTIQGEEGAFREVVAPSDWWKESKRLEQRDAHPTLAALMDFKNFGDMKMDQNVSAWSRVRFLLDEHPDAFAAFLGDLMGQLDERGYPSGHDLLGLQRRLLQEHFGWNPVSFDEHWRAWLEAQ